MESRAVSLLEGGVKTLLNPLLRLVSAREEKLCSAARSGRSFTESSQMNSIFYSLDFVQSFVILPFIGLDSLD